jgi:ParB family chromosome partitioning protein
MIDMTIVQKIALSASRDIPFNKLTLSQANVRRVKAGVSIEELAEDIARRGLLQSLCVRPVCDADGGETGMFEVPAGGRRFRALQLLVKQKRMSKTQPVPCIIREDGIAEEDSLAENVQRATLHPLDQFRAFHALREKGLCEEDIAARFFVTPAVVKQRLKLATVSPKLLDVYADDGMTLEQLMAFTVANDHARQEEVWAALERSYSKEPYVIRRQLTEGAVRASDRRARFVGVEAYEAAGGVLMRDLFQHDDGGWLEDSALLERLAKEKLAAEAESLRAEGWKWIETAIDFPYGHTAGLRRLPSSYAPISAQDQAHYDAAVAEYNALSDDYEGADEVPEEVDRRFAELEKIIADVDERPANYEPVDIARAGVFVSLDANGALRIERGYVRPEDERPVERIEGDDEEASRRRDPAGADRVTPSAPREPATSPEDEKVEAEDDLRPLSDRLIAELSAHRTLALRDALANDPRTAFAAVLHAMCLSTFYHQPSGSCLELTLKSASFGAQAPGLSDSASAKAIEARHEEWAKRLPMEDGDLWTAVLALDGDARAALFAHCVSLAVNALIEPWNRNPRRLAHADTLAAAVKLDMAAAGWTPTVENYLGRVPKARILEAVREAKGDASARLIEHLKKPDMAREAERLIEGSGWLPEPLRTPDVARGMATGEHDDGGEPMPAFLADDDETVDDAGASEADDPERAAVAAE